MIWVAIGLLAFTEWFIWVYNNARGCNSSKSQESPNHVKSPAHFRARMSHVTSIVYLSRDHCLPLQVVSPAMASGSSEGHLCCGRFPRHLPTWASFFSLCRYAMFEPSWQPLMNSFAIDGLFISCHISSDMSPRVLLVPHIYLTQAMSNYNHILFGLLKSQHPNHMAEDSANWWPTACWASL